MAERAAIADWACDGCQCT